MAGAERAFSATGNRWAFPGSRQIQRTTCHKARQLAPCSTPCLPAERFSCGLCAALLPVLGAVVVPHFLISRFFAAAALPRRTFLALPFDQPCAASAALRSCLLAAGQLLIAFLVVGCWSSCPVPCCCLFCARVVVPHCAASAAPQKRMAAGHPFMGRGSRLDRGNPGGVPRPQAALRRFVLRRWSSYPRFRALQLLVFKYLKKAICSKLLVGAVDNPEKLGGARVCGLWKSRGRE